MFRQCCSFDVGCCCFCGTLCLDASPIQQLCTGQAALRAQRERHTEEKCPDAHTLSFPNTHQSCTEMQFKYFLTITSYNRPEILIQIFLLDAYYYEWRKVTSHFSYQKVVSGVSMELNHCYHMSSNKVQPLDCV